MMRATALLALLAGASALHVSVEKLEETQEMLNKMLAEFEKKDLKDPMVYQEYQAVREGAKKNSEMLVKQKVAYPPHPDDWHNDDDELEAEDIEVEKAEAVALKAKLEEDKMEKEEEADHITVEEETPKKYDRKTAKKMKLKAQAAEGKAKLEKFQSPYRTASKQEVKEITVIDEGKGNYGRFGETILSSFIEEEPKKILSLEATIAKREKELQEEAVQHKVAIKNADKARKMCGPDTHCIETVDAKLARGFYDRQLKEKPVVKNHKV